MENIIETLSDVFALAKNCTDFVKEILDATKKEKNNKDFAKLASSGDSAQLASSGDSAQLASSGDSAQLASSGDSAQLASSGYFAKLASSGDFAQLASSGDSAQLASSGDYAKLASSGDSAQLASSGDSAKIDSTGKKAVISAIGIESAVKAKKGSWITLAEYKRNKNNYREGYWVKTEFVDGENIKEDTWYCLYNKEFHQYMEFDNIGCAVLSQKGNVFKVHNFNSDKESYVVTDGEYFSHGDTIKQAKADLIYKISNRDTSQYKDLTLDSVVTKAEAIKMYRVITGACEAGTKHFVSGLTKTKAKYKVSELIKLTAGQYGNETFKNFFEGK